MGVRGGGILAGDWGLSLTFVEEGEVDLDDLVITRGFKMGERGVAEVQDRRVGAVEPLATDTQCPLLTSSVASHLAHRPRWSEQRTCAFSFDVGSSHDAIPQLQICHTPCHRSNHTCTGSDVGGWGTADAVVRWLEAVDAAVGGGDADAAAPVAAKCQGKETAGYGRGGGGGGTAYTGREERISGVAYGTGELGRVGSAEMVRVWHRHSAWHLM